MPRSLTDKVIVITGASSGIGASTAVECARAGMDVVLKARRRERLEAVAERVRELGRDAELVVGDVTDEGASRRALDAAETRFGRCDVVFANAGYGIETPMVHMTTDKLRHIFEVNFFSSVDLLQHAARRMIEQGRPGHLLMCSSCLAKFTMPYYAAYSATKAAQNHVCRALRLELAHEGIQVSSVHPITTKTEFFAGVAAASGNDEPGAADVPDHAPQLFVQPPQRVARAIVRCLRRPRAEVWTSHIVRFSAALMTLFPPVLDLSMRREASRRRHLMERQSDRASS